MLKPLRPTPVSDPPESDTPMKFFRAKVRLWPLIVIPTVLIAAVVAVFASGVLKPVTLAALFSGGQRGNSSEVIKYVLPQQEVVLAGLRIEGLERASDDGELFGIAGVPVPASERLTYIEYEFDAKLGIDGSAVEITPTGENAYTVLIPEFIFIGHSNEHFSDPIENNGILSWLTKEISETEMVNNILSADKKDEYVANSLQVLKDQSEAFYGSIIRSVDADAKLTFEFTN